jgi:hypothetical protein
MEGVKAFKFGDAVILEVEAAKQRARFEVFDLRNAVSL